MRKQLRAYYWSNAIYDASICFMGTTYILFLRQLGLSFFQIGVINIAFIFVSIIFNIPTGIIADKIGRKRAFIIACLLNGAMLLSYFFAKNFLHCLIVESLAGVAYAFYQGSIMAHIVDKLHENGKEEETSQVFSVGNMITCCLRLIGGVCGAYLGRHNLAIPFILGGIASFASGIYGFIALDEPKIQGNGKIKMWQETISGIREIVGRREIFIMVLAFSGAAFLLQVFIKMWSPYVRPLVVSQEALAPVWIVFVLGNILGSIISYKIRSRKFAWFLVFQIIACLSLVTAVFMPGFVLKIACFGILETGFGTGALYFSELNKNFVKEKRATLLSASGTLVSFGTVAGLLAGVFADHFSIPITFVGAGIITTAFLIFAAAKFLKIKNPH